MCFPICKSQAMVEKFGSERYIRVGILHKKCKLFEKWYDRSGYPTEKIKECFNTSYTSWLETSMKKIPCKNCICFPVCKNQAVEKVLVDRMNVSLKVLHKKCKLFEKWYNTVKYVNYFTEEVRECFNASSASWGNW
jgi:hypothetical protein